MRTKIAPSHHAIATLLTDDIISEMPQYLMEDYGYTLEKALDVVYRSKTVELLQIEKGELYVQSPAYVYDMLLQELHLHPRDRGGFFVLFPKIRPRMRRLQKKYGKNSVKAWQNIGKLEFIV